MFLPLGGEFIFKGTSVSSDTYCTYSRPIALASMDRLGLLGLRWTVA